VILLEIDPCDSTIKKSYVYAGDQIIMQHDGGMNADKYFYLHDRLGSVRQVIDVNASVEHLYTYGPFGKKLEADDDDPCAPGNPFQFTGLYFDYEIDGYDARAREFFSELMRFTSRDPITGNFNEPLTLHTHLYCLNEPVNRTDPDGEFSFFGTMGAAARYGSNAYSAYSISTSIFGYAQQIANGVSMRNVLLSASVDVACNMGIAKGIGFLTKAAVPALNKLGKSIYHFAKRKGHHIIPKWAGGFEKQLLHELPWEKHSILEKKIRGRMRKYGIKIGGRGNTRANTMKYIHENGLQPDVFRELQEIYMEFDSEYGTGLYSGFVINYLEMLYEVL